MTEIKNVNYNNININLLVDTPTVNIVGECKLIKNKKFGYLIAEDIKMYNEVEKPLQVHGIGLPNVSYNENHKCYDRKRNILGTFDDCAKICRELSFKIIKLS